MKGILLAGGAGSRMAPMTLALTKQLLPVYSKPLIYYPLSILMLAGVKEILVISSPEHLASIRSLLGSGAQWGLKLDYLQQDRPAGIAQAVLLAEDFIGTDSVCLALGDNILYGAGLQRMLSQAGELNQGARILACEVEDPERYGVAEFDAGGRVISLEEKPSNPTSRYAVTGFYFYDSTAVAKAKTLHPSPRGELEITDLNRLYLEEGSLTVERFGRGFAWLDAGTPESLLESSNFVRSIEQRQGLMVACLEEIALRAGFIDRDTFQESVEKFQGSSYGEYLKQLLQDRFERPI
jgi:glucose-1-phosphate thymidylyltransferase